MSTSPSAFSAASPMTNGGGRTPLRSPTSGGASDPRAHYQARLAEERARCAVLERRLGVLVWVRLAAIVGCLVLGYEACGRRAIAGGWVWLGLAGLVALSVVIEMIARRLALLGARVLYYDAGLARVEERWQGGAEDGLAHAHLPEDHPFALDLDLFGKGSLFGLLCVARTTIGKETLAQWLMVPAGIAEVAARQQAVRELAERQRLREEIWQAAGRVVGEVKAEEGARRLESWLEEPPRPVPRLARALGLLLALAALPALWQLVEGNTLLPLVVFSAQALFAHRLRGVREPVSARAGRRAEELRVVGGLVARFEDERFHSEALIELRRALVAEGLSTRRRLGRLIRLVELLDARRNLAFAVLSAPFLFGTQVALAIEAWRQRHGRVAAGWVRAVGTIEALSSLATFTFEHPRFVWPTVVSESEGPILDGEALAHPLLPAATRVANDVALGGGAPQLVLITGSNMSGKSTLLRTVGINIVLALAGAPVCARSLRVSRLQVGATLRVQDSLQAGTSRFLAEITRLRAVVAMSEESPHVLFLLDEILHGTNSRDRGAGGAAILKALVASGAIGFATTHDLSLTALADELAPRAANAHFQDRVEGGKLVFDYAMQPGVVSRSNALDLMRLVGLKV